MQGVLFFFLLLAASFVDLKRREIPDWVSGSIAALTLLHFRPEYLPGLIPALFFLAAAVRGGLGGGDVKLLMVCAISIGRAMPRFLILSFICNGIYAVIFLWKRKNFHLRLFRLFQYVTQCKDNKRLLMYETENGDLMKDGMIHFSFGILAAYMICLLGGGL